jgi:hypothetical protein
VQKRASGPNRETPAGRIYPVSVNFYYAPTRCKLLAFRKASASCSAGAAPEISGSPPRRMVGTLSMPMSWARSIS